MEMSRLPLILIALARRADFTVALPNITRDCAFDWIGESIAEHILDALLSEGQMVLDRVD